MQIHKRVAAVVAVDIAISVFLRPLSSHPYTHFKCLFAFSFNSFAWVSHLFHSYNRLCVPFICRFNGSRHSGADGCRFFDTHIYSIWNVKFVAKSISKQIQCIAPRHACKTDKAFISYDWKHTKLFENRSSTKVRPVQKPHHRKVSHTN